MRVSISTFVMTLFNFILFFPSSKECTLSFTKDHNSIFFGVITTPNCSYQQFVYNAWIKKLPLFVPESGVAFIANEGIEIPGILYLHPGEKYEYLKKLPGSPPMQRDIVIKRLVGAKYFIENTAYDWFWSLSDDTFILPENIPHVLNDLNSRFNTYKDPHIEGHCIGTGHETYMQGGSGYLFSRKAAEIFIENAIPFLKRMTSFDDFDFQQIRKIMGVSPQQSASKFMSGHVFSNIVNDSLYENLDYCPKDINSTVCYGTKLFSIKHMTGYHSLKACSRCKPQALKEALDIIQIQRILHPDISYYHDKFYLHFCKKNIDDDVI